MFWVSLESNQAEPIISDLTEREAARFETMEPVSSDDVLDMHLALKDFEGTPEELLG